MVIEAGVAKGAWYLTSGNSVKLDNKQSQLTLYSSDVFACSAGDQKNIYIDAPLGDMHLDIFVDQQFKAFRFSDNATRPTENVYTADLHITIGDNVNLISMTTLANNTLWNDDTKTDICTKSIIFDKFKSGVIHVDSIDTNIDMSLISSLSGEWINFRFDDNNYLIADLIPEPSTYAAIFGAIALALAAKRRRK